MAVDDKVVSIAFESSKFESGVNSTIAALDKLKAALHFPEAGKGLDDINSAAKRVDLSHISRGVDAVKSALDSLRLVAIGVMSQLAAQAVRAGGRFIKAFTLDPIKAGFQEYSTNLNAIQTILANTQASGAKLKDVNAALDELNRYSDKTIYNFSQMAKNIGTFTAAGVDLKTATASIKGIANLAALSGSNADQASTAMYQLSQAIAAGSVKLQDWNSVVNAGMGGTVFQRALAQTAEAMGTLEKGAVKLEGPMKNVSIHGEAFRQSLSTPGKASWLTSKVLTQTLKEFTGDLSNADLAAQGFTKSQIAAIQQTAKTAMHAATEVKTISQVFDVAKETAGSGWAKTFQIIFGNFNEAKGTFTALSNTINGFINTNADARNKVLADWKALGGRTVLIDGIKTAFHNLGLIIAPIKDAFRDIFPAASGKNLYDLTVTFKNFAEALKPSATTVDNLRSTFRGLFALLDIGKQIVSGIFTVFGKLFGAVGKGSGGFLGFTAAVGDFIVKIDEALKKGDGIHKFFSGLGDVLAIPIKLLGELAGAIADLFGGFSSGGFSGQINGMTKAMTPFQAAINALSTAWHDFISSLSDSGALQAAFAGLLQFFGQIGPAIGNALSTMNFDAILQVIRTGLFGALVLMLRDFFGKGSLLAQISKGFGGGIISNIAGSFKALEGSMVSFQNNIKANTLKEIAIAIGILTASVVALSFVDPAKLNKALFGIGVMMGELLGAMKILDKISSTGGFIKLPIIAAGLIVLAGAIDLLVIAVYALSRLSWEELLKGLGGVGALLVGISAAAVPLSANSAGMIRAGIGIGAIAVAMKILASAMADFGDMSWTEIGKGLVSVAGGLVILAGAAQLMPKGMVLTGAGLIAVSIGLKIIASAVAQFGGMDWGVIGKGLVGIAGALVIIAGAMRLMPNMILTGAGLLLVSVALGKIADAVQSMGGMSLGQIAKGLGTLAGSLVILAGALYLMSGSVGGAVALGIAAAGIALLAPALIALGGLSWESILKGLITLAGALAAIGIAAALLTPVIPAMLGLGAALILIGGGLALAGAGIFLISTGLSALAVSAPAGIGIIVAAFTELVKGVIENAKLLVLGVLEIVKTIAAVAPQFADAFAKILISLLDVIIQAAPKIAQAFDALLQMALTVIHNNQAKIVQAGFDLIVALLTGIRNNIPQLMALITDIITRILTGISNSLGRIVTAGSSILINLIKGIAQHIGDVTTAVGDIITRFLSGIANSLGRIATAGISIVTRLLSAIAQHLPDVIKMGVDIVVEFINGIGNAGSRIVAAGTNAIIKFINAVEKGSVKLINAGMEAIVNFLNGVAAAINAHSGEMRAAGFNVGIAIVDGMTGGLLSKAQGLYSQVSGIMSKAMSLMHSIPGVRSPSTVTKDIGENIILGLVKGLDDNASDAYSSAIAVSNGVIRAFNDTFKTASPSKVMYDIGKFVGQGFAQGLRGSTDDIKGAFGDLNSKLAEAMKTARQTITEEQKKLNEERAKSTPDAQVIREAQATIRENESILARSTAAHKVFTGALKDEKSELLGLANDYQKITDKLKAAQGALDDAKKTKADAIKSFTDQYDRLPDIVTKDAEGNAINQLATYEDALKHQADAVGAYQATLDQLRQLGLDDATYQKLLQEGTADQEFATQLLAGGKTAVDSLNVLDKQLYDVSRTLATNASTNLYQAGIDAATGLVNGLKSKKSDIRAAMEEIADEIVTSLQRKLKIKSPSEVMAEIGRQSMAGMVKGFDESSKAVTDAADQVAKDAISAMKESMRDISDVVMEGLDSSPVITPVLDLTQIRKQSEELGALTKVTPITAAASFGQASRISSEQAAAAQTEQPVVGPGGTSVKFEQNNYSPESLTEIEIYRQTKNQLSQLKSALALT